MKATAIVAHPDDCVIFAWSFIQHHPWLEWSVCYLTYQEHDDRAKELSQFWNDKNIPVHFLGYIDEHKDLETGRCSFDTNRASIDIRNHVANQAIVLTHDSKGDYGHLHHKFVHDVVAACHDRVVTFADNQSGNVEYFIENPDYSSLQIHRDIVQSFHINGHRNRYLIPPSVLQILEEFTK